MTALHKKHIENLAEHFRTLAEENPNNKQTMMYALLRAQTTLTHLMMDLHLKPEAC